MSRHPRRLLGGGHQGHVKESAGVTLNLPSGYSVRVRPMPPYYIDIVEDALPLPEYPKRRIVLTAGDVIEIDYKPPENMPSEQDADYELYLRWLAADQRRVEVERLRKRARMDYLLSTCVDIVGDGPKSYKNPTWMTEVEAAFPNYKVPVNPGKRRLVFLKTYVISAPEWMDLILRTALAEEATMQGIMSALRSFQH